MDDATHSTDAIAFAALREQHLHACNVDALHGAIAIEERLAAWIHAANAMLIGGNPSMASPSSSPIAARTIDDRLVHEAVRTATLGIASRDQHSCLIAVHRATTELDEYRATLGAEVTHFRGMIRKARLDPQSVLCVPSKSASLRDAPQMSSHLAAAVESISVDSADASRDDASNLVGNIDALRGELATWIQEREDIRARVATAAEQLKKLEWEIDATQHNCVSSMALQDNELERRRVLGQLQAEIGRLENIVDTRFRVLALPTRGLHAARPPTR